MSTNKPEKRRSKSGKGKSANVSANFLIGSSKDAALDDIFGKSSAFAPVAPASAPAPTVAPSSVVAEAGPSQPDKKRAHPGPSAPEQSRRTKSKKNQKKEKQASSVSKEKDSESDVSLTLTPSAAPATLANSPEADGADEDEDEDELSNLVHETVSKPKKVKARTTTYTPPDETPADKSRRTIFVGNLPVECASSKKGDKHLSAHLLTFAPSAKVESVRFRSIAFSVPTAGVPGEEDGDKKKKRESERSAAWKAEQEKIKKGGKDAEEADKSKTFLDAKGKRKVAFIKKDFHDEAATCNAYVVFAHAHPDRPKNVAPILDPYEAATTVLAANGSTFMDRTIRVDSLRDPSKVGLADATTALSRRNAWLPSGTDPKKSVFVGGLDYAAKEEDVRAFFESLLVAERGEPETHYVSEVRIVRDKETQLGKGFGYVHFSDRESVDEVLALDPTKLKFAKKTIRVQPSKTLPSPNPRPAPSATAAPTTKGKQRIVPASIPKGDPKLGDKLKDLSKDERKLAKNADADRQARRLAKKQKRVAMQVEEKGAVKLGPTKSGRKVDKAKKSRVRSSHALSKMKGSRT